MSNVFAVLRTEGRDRESDSRVSGRLCELAQLPKKQRAKVMPDDHSEVVPLLPIPNRTVKRLCADDSADSRVKVGHCQANILKPDRHYRLGFILLAH